MDIKECPCQSGKSYQICCEPAHLGIAAENAEKLMRSRYSAYVLGLEPYLLASWHPATRPAALNLEEDSSTKWLGLQVKSYVETDPTHANVEFLARYKVNGRAYRLHENSRFEKIDGRWYYCDGDIKN